MSYVELHARSAFSFLRGASNPEDLAKCAVELELPAVALLDRDGLYGAPRFFAPMREHGARARVGVELTLEDGTVLPLLAATRTGYQNLCQLLTEARLVDRSAAADRPASGLSGPPRPLPPEARERKRPCFATWNELTRYCEGLIALTGDEEGPVRHAWRNAGIAAAGVALERLRTIFGPDRLYVELQRHRIRGEEREVKFLTDLAAATGLPLLATGGVNQATSAGRATADVFTCLRRHTTLDAAGRALAQNSGRHLKSAVQMSELFRDLPVALENSLRLEERIEFTLEDLGYRFPDFPVPAGETMEGFLRARTFESARDRFGELPPTLAAQLDRELALINRLGFAGYFLIVWDICRWARAQGTLVQGRGSAANSAVCYVLGITAVNPLEHRLLFDRFLTDGRKGANGRPSWPDIDLDLPSGDRREAVIQEIYRRYAARGAAMTANVITYRGRSTVREIGKVLGFAEDALDRFSGLYANGDFPQRLDLQEQLRMSGIPGQHPRAAAMVGLYHQIRGLPRHLGQHSGGMVICAGQLDRVMPLEPASMPGRVVCQWDKDDCEDLGIIKVDFLGLGMMAVLQDSLALCAARGGPTQLKDIPTEDPETFARIRVADTVGVFQIESRAQMATLPRFKPRCLYDLAMQVAIIRPGPITGDLVHPLIRRRDGKEVPDYIDPSVEAEVKPILERTMGVILFQEQMLELSMTLAKFDGAEAEQLRRAMGFTKGQQRLEAALAKLATALRREGRNEAVVTRVTHSARSFAAYGFPESHAISFALLAYASTWLKVHRPAEFYASLLNHQPMGFYSPASLLQDARRHGLKVLPVCVVTSEWNCTVIDPQTIRIGLRYVKGLREAAAQHLLAARTERPFASLDDFLRRTQCNAGERRDLAAVGALNAFTGHRRAALWQVEAAWSEQESLFRHYAAKTEETELQVAENASPLVPMNLTERLRADFEGLDLTAGTHPMALLRARLPDVTTARDLKDVPNGRRVTIAGSVICRQRPGTAKGFVFISLEDETGIANSVVLPAFFEQHRLVITQEPSLKITGPLQNVAGVTHVKAEKIEPLTDTALPAQASHDFR
jgi:error-prone DNA polymerase